MGSELSENASTSTTGSEDVSEIDNSPPLNPSPPNPPPPNPPPPNPSANQSKEKKRPVIEKRPHSLSVLLSTIALLISLASALASFYSVGFAEKQYQLATAVRQDGIDAAKRQDASLQNAARAAIENLKATQKSADAAQASADSGKESLRVSKHALLLNEEPAVQTAKPILIDRVQYAVGGGLKPIVMQTNTLNTGKGPAYNVRILQAAVNSYSWTFDWKNTHEMSAEMLSPNTSGLTVTSTTGPFVFREHSDSRSHAYVYGAVFYEERSFEGTHKHAYTYCFDLFASGSSDPSENKGPGYRTDKPPSPFNIVSTFIECGARPPIPYLPAPRH
jgi:hypothetical protein